jgi:FtsP/CotA-like multicopper oxidase with cupredoxin domain
MITRRAVTAGLATTLIVLSRQTRAQSSGPSEQALTAKPTPMKLRPDASGEADIWTFNGSLSPAVRIKHGAELRLKLQNETALPLSLHFHGVRAPTAMDGVGGLSQEPVTAGKSHEYRFTPPDAGTFLIRPCVLGGSAESMERGLSGLLIVEESDPPQVDQDLALLVDDWRLNDDGSLASFEKPAEPAPAGRLGSWLSVNGKGTPKRL